MEEENWSFQMVINIVGNGLMTWSMDMEKLSMSPQEWYTMGNGLVIKCMEWEQWVDLITISTMESGDRVSNMEKVWKSMKKKVLMKDTLKMDLGVELGNLCLKMEVYLKGSGRMIKRMAVVFYVMLMGLCWGQIG